MSEAGFGEGVDSVQPADVFAPAGAGVPDSAGLDSSGRDSAGLDSSGEPGLALRPRRAPGAALGTVALSLAAVCVVADVMAVILATQRYWNSATLIAQGTIVATIVVFVVGLFAAFRRPARWLGIGAMVVAVLANPFILTHLLNFLEG